MIQSAEFDTAEMLMRLDDKSDRNSFQDSGDASVRILRSTFDTTETSDMVDSETGSAADNFTWGVSAWGRDAW